MSFMLPIALALYRRRRYGFPDKGPADPGDWAKIGESMMGRGRLAGSMARIAVGAVAVVAATHPAMASEVHRKAFGHLKDGAAVEAVTLTNRHGMSATILTYGATLQSLLVPDEQQGQHRAKEREESPSHQIAPF